MMIVIITVLFSLVPVFFVFGVSDCHNGKSLDCEFQHRSSYNHSIYNRTYCDWHPISGWFLTMVNNKFYALATETRRTALLKSKRICSTQGRVHCFSVWFHFSWGYQFDLSVYIRRLRTNGRAGTIKVWSTSSKNGWTEATVPVNSNDDDFDIIIEAKRIPGAHLSAFVLINDTSFQSTPCLLYPPEAAVQPTPSTASIINSTSFRGSIPEDSPIDVGVIIAPVVAVILVVAICVAIVRLYRQIKLQGLRKEIKKEMFQLTAAGNAICSLHSEEPKIRGQYSFSASRVDANLTEQPSDDHYIVTPRGASVSDPALQEVCVNVNKSNESKEQTKQTESDDEDAEVNKARNCKDEVGQSKVNGVDENRRSGEADGICTFPVETGVYPVVDETEAHSMAITPDSAISDPKNVAEADDEYNAQHVLRKRSNVHDHTDDDELREVHSHTQMGDDDDHNEAYRHRIEEETGH